MLCKLLKVGVLSAAAVAAAGAVFGHDLPSYVRSAARSVRTSVKSSVPVEFQLRRAHDLLDDVGPETHADIRAIAQQEVEIDALRQEIDRGRGAVADQVAAVSKLRDALNTADASFTVGHVRYTRDQLRDELSGRLAAAEADRSVLDGRERLLAGRERALAAAEQALDRAKLQKSALEAQVATLEGQYKLMQAAGGPAGGPAGGEVPFAIDQTKLAQTQQVLDEVRQQLDVSEHVMAHEAKFADAAVPVGTSEQAVMHQAADFLARTAPPTEAAAK